jgi:putative aldouronate transport system permease protein
MKLLNRRNREIIDYNFMLLPAMILLGIFYVYPFFGSIMAFKYLDPVKGIWGSPWAGLDHFRTLFSVPEFKQITINTVFISVTKIILNISAAIVFALLLNEVRRMWFKRSVQTIVYLPFFLSWVVMAGIFIDIFSLDGFVNGLYNMITGAEKIMFFTNPGWFLAIIFSTDVWKNFGFNAVIFLAALTAINPNLYEAAEVDGASRWKKIFHVTLPGIKPTIIVILILSLQGILSGGFDQIFNFYNPMVYNVADIYDTYIYRMGFQGSQFEFATAVGLFRSVIAFLFVFVSQWLAGKFANYKVF